MISHLPHSTRLVLLPALAYGALHLAGLFYPARLWGTDQLHYYPAAIQLASVLAFTATLLIAARPSWTARADALAARLFLRIPEAVHRRGPYLAAGLFVLLAYTFRDRTHYLGDSAKWFGLLERIYSGYTPGMAPYANQLDISGFEYINYHQPLELLLHFLAYRGGRALFGWSATATYEWTSCIAGGLFVLALWSLAAAALPRTGGRRTLFAFLLSMGTTQLFFGYGENYTLATLASALYAGSALRYLNGDAKLIWPTTCLLLTIGLHLLFLTLAPSWFYLLWKDRGRIGLFLRQSRHLLPLAALCSLTGLWAYNAHYRGQHLPLFQTAEPGFYPIFSLPHLANLSNEVLLLSPFGLLWALAELRRIRTASPQQHFAAWAFLGTASLIGVHYIQMGGRDWDLMAAPGLFYALWGALSLAALDAKRLFPIIRVFIIPITALHTALWIGINHNPQRGLDRLGNLLYHTPNQPVHYQHFTRGHYLLNIRRAGYDQAADAFRQALAHRPANDPQATARYFKFLGTALTQSGHYRQAATSFDSAYAAQSDSLTFAADADFHYYWALACGALAETHRGTPAAQQWWQQAATQARRSVHIEAFYDNNLLLAQTLEALGQFADAIYYYRASLALREDATEALSNLGRAFLRSNRHREAIPVFQQLIKSQPTNQSAHTLIARAHIYLENYAAAAAAYRHLLQLNPDDNQARYNLGVMYLTLGDAEKARQIYDRLVASKDPLADRLQQLMVRQPSNSP